MNFITIYKSMLAIAAIGIFTMCKSDVKSAETTNATKSEKVVSIDVAVDSSMVDFTRTIDLQYVSLPQMYRWSVISKSLLKLNNNPSGYVVTDTISWIHPSGKSYMSMSHYTKTNEETIDYKMFYEKVKSSYSYNEYSYTKYRVGELSMHEIKLSNDKTHNYKLVIPKGNEIVSIDLQSYDDGYNEEIEKFIQQIPGLVMVH